MTMIRAAIALAVCFIATATATDVFGGNEASNMQFKCSNFKPRPFNSYYCQPTTYNNNFPTEYYSDVEECVCYYYQHSIAWYTMVSNPVRHLLAEIKPPFYEFTGSEWRELGEEVDSDKAYEKYQALGRTLKQRSNNEKLIKDCQRLVHHFKQQLERLPMSGIPRMELVIAAHDKNFLTLLNGYWVCKKLV